jgi:DNA (cytosine-5)-methyltransferase 1
VDTNIRSGGSGFRFVDLFAGIGGFHLALEALGGTCVLASEIDLECQQVYRTRFPSTPLVGDIRKLTQDVEAIPEHDVLAAGFPCQPFSKSGAQLGLRDKTRGTLFFHRDTWRVIIDSLREERYRVSEQPVVFSPHLLSPDPEFDGRPQVRERVFILAEQVEDGDVIGRPLVEHQPVSGWDPRQWTLDGLLDDDDVVDLSEYRLRPIEIKWLEAWDEFVQLIDEDPLPGFPIWVDAFKVRPRIPRDTPAWKADFLRKNSAFYSRHRRRIDAWMARHSVGEFPPSRRKFEWQARGQPHSIWNLLIHLRPSGIRVRPATYVPALVAITQTSIIGPRRRRLTPREAARLQGFPDDFNLHASPKVAYRQLGNAVNVGVVKHMARALMGRANVRGHEDLLLVG